MTSGIISRLTLYALWFSVLPGMRICPHGKAEEPVPLRPVVAHRFTPR